MNGQDYLDAASRLQRVESLDPWTALMRVLVARLERMVMPAPLEPALVHAASHWSGQPLDLLEDKGEVWRYIRAIGPSGSDVETPEGRAARALLCVLEPYGDEETLSMTAEWFAAMTSDE